MHLLACTVCTWRSSECCCLETFVSDLRLLLCSDFMLPIFLFWNCKKNVYKQCSAVSKHCEVSPFASCFCSVFVRRPCLLCTGVRLNVNAFCISYCVFQHAGTLAALQQASLLFIYGKTRLKRLVHVKVKAEAVLNCAVMSLFPFPPVCKPVSNLVIYT